MWVDILSHSSAELKNNDIGYRLLKFAHWVIVSLIGSDN